MRLLFILACTIVAVQSEEVPEELKSHRNWKLIDRGDKCGRSKPSDRIIGGKDASLGQFPWIALIFATFPMQKPQFFCGGSVINERYVLTAAHCLLDVGGKNELNRFISFVRLGEHDTTTFEDCDSNNKCAPPAQDVPVERMVYHPEYTNEDHIHDIGVIRLAAPIQFNKFVSPICLPTYEGFKNNNFLGLHFEVAGWGSVDTVTKETATVLSFLKVPVIDLNICDRKLEMFTNIDQHNIICAGGVVGKDSCVGDSGGPLMGVFDYGGRPRQFLVGVVSFGAVDCGGDLPGVYTRVSDYLLWVLDNISE